MGIFDKLKGLLAGNADKVKEGVDKAGAMVDEKTGGKYAEKIDNATEKIGDIVDQQTDTAADATDAAADGADAVADAADDVTGTEAG